MKEKRACRPRRRGRGAGRERDDPLVAHRRVDDRVEVDEGVVPRGVVVLRGGLLGAVRRAHRRVAAGRGLARGVVAHVLHVALPAQALGLKLPGERLHRARVHAADAERLPVAADRAGLQVDVVRAVRLRVGVRRLPADQRDVVVEALVADPVVLRDQRPVGRQRLGEVGRRGVRRERRAVALVLEHDQPDVLDRRRGSRGGAGRQAAREQGSRKQSAPAETSQPPCPHTAAS